MSLSGNLALTSLADVLQLYAARGEAVAIHTESELGPEHSGVFYIEGGELVDATLAEFDGLEAAKAGLRLSQGRFTVERGARSTRRTINVPLRRLLFEANTIGADENTPTADGAAGLPPPTPRAASAARSSRPGSTPPQRTTGTLPPSVPQRHTPARPASTRRWPRARPPPA